jgi:hypothetical protein
MKKFRSLVREARVEDEGPPSVAAATLKDKPNKEPMPKLKEENDTREKVEMSQSQLHFIHYACEEILEFIDDGGEVEEWYQVKIAKAFSEFESLHSFMEGEKRRTGMVKEAMAQPDYSQSIKARQAKADKDNAPFDADKKPVARATPGKQGIGPSTAKHLAKTAMQRQMKKEETEQIDEISSELAMKVSDGRFKRAMAMDRNDPKKPEATAKLSRAGASARKRITRDMIKDPEKANRGFASDADKNTKRGWSNESVEIAERMVESIDGDDMAHAARQAGLRHGREGVGNNMDRPKKEWGDHFKHYNAGFLKGRNEKAKGLKAVGQGYGKRQQGMAKEEVEQIDELSKKTLGSYIKSASHDVAAKAAATRQHAVDAHRKMADQDFTGGRESMKKSDKSFSDSWKRRQNMAKAVDRLTKEDVQTLEEKKNKPTNPELWSRAVAQAKSKFDVYPSAYANGWAAKWYKERGGGWKSVNEAEERATEPFLKTSRKTEIVKSAAKKKNGKNREIRI